MSDRQYRATTSGLLFDAFYSDEFGRINDDVNSVGDAAARKGFHKSRFTSVFERNGVTAESSNFGAFTFDNQANPNENGSLIVKQHGCPAKGADKRTARAYFSNSVIAYWHSALSTKAKWETPINLTVLFAVATEINRHGLRTFFESRTNMQGLILIPGVEPKKGETRIGVSPSTAVIKAMLDTMFSMDVPFKVKVLAAFSTGYCGLNSCLQNELLDLAGVERLVFYDCLYGAGADVSTVAAVQKLQSKVAKDKFKLVAYKCTPCGNTLADAATVKCSESKETRLDPRLAGLFTSGRPGLIENLYYNMAYVLLVTHRLLSAAFDDHVIAMPGAPFQRAFDNLKAVVPKRGYMISNIDAFRFVHGSSVDVSKYTELSDWARKNKSELRDFGRFLGSKSNAASIRGLIWSNQLPGWPGGDGEENHDLLLPEFGWEYLPY